MATVLLRTYSSLPGILEWRLRFSTQSGKSCISLQDPTELLSLYHKYCLLWSCCHLPLPCGLIHLLVSAVSIPWERQQAPIFWLHYSHCYKRQAYIYFLPDLRAGVSEELALWNKFCPWLCDSGFSSETVSSLSSASSVPSKDWKVEKARDRCLWRGGELPVVLNLLRQGLGRPH